MPESIKCFLVDDEPVYLKLLQDNLQQYFLDKLDISTFSTGEACLENLGRQPEIVILDYYLNRIDEHASNGIDVLKSIKEADPSIQVVMLSQQDSIDVALETIKYGAYDYVVKNESAFVRIQNTLEKIMKYLELSRELDQHKNKSRFVWLPLEY